MTKTGAAARPEIATDSDTIGEWLELHVRQISYGALAVALLAGGVWLWTRSKALRSQRAETAYYEAQRSLIAGNIPLAESDLRKMITRYQGTTAANQATLVLSEVLYDEEKYADGVAELQKVIGKAGPLESSALALLASGLEEQKKYAEAAAYFQKAAAASDVPVDRDNYRADAARAYTAAGNRKAARQLWTELTKDPAGPVAGEARVRLGELDATPATKG
jgi:tetratricopeptide (TPR) repeat protein